MGLWLRKVLCHDVSLTASAKQTRSQERVSASLWKSAGHMYVLHMNVAASRPHSREERSGMPSMSHP